jgi:hypothetical protein
MGNIEQLLVKKTDLEVLLQSPCWWNVERSRQAQCCVFCFDAQSIPSFSVTMLGWLAAPSALLPAW